MASDYPALEWWWGLEPKARNLIAQAHFPEGWQEQVDMAVTFLQRYGQSRKDIETSMIRHFLERANVSPPGPTK